MQTKIFTEYGPYFNLLNDPKIEVKGEVQIDEKHIVVSYKYADDRDAPPTKSNPALAAWCTSYARLKLYEELEKLESSRRGRVLYFDTDSIIFRSKAGEYEPDLGDQMGEMTDELVAHGEGARITKFVSCGPKNYGYQYKLADGTTSCVLKAKGLRLHSKALDVVSFETFFQTAVDYVNGINTKTAVPQFTIQSDKQHNVYSRYFDKFYAAVSDKRRIVSVHQTLPYGFRE